MLRRNAAYSSVSSIRKLDGIAKTNKRNQRSFDTEWALESLRNGATLRAIAASVGLSLSTVHGKLCDVPEYQNLRKELRPQKAGKPTE
jgi:hypothetical protein